MLFHFLNDEKKSKKITLQMNIFLFQTRSYRNIYVMFIVRILCDSVMLYIQFYNNACLFNLKVQPKVEKKIQKNNKLFNYRFFVHCPNAKRLYKKYICVLNGEWLIFILQCTLYTYTKYIFTKYNGYIYILTTMKKQFK